jgi:putative dehydrogenase
VPRFVSAPVDIEPRTRDNHGYAQTILKNKDNPMAETIGIIAMGEMGSATARRLHEHGATVTTSLAGRSAASAARAEKAGAIPVSTDDELVGQVNFILSIVPPGDAVALAERLAPALKRAKRKPVYVDCNAVSPQTAERIGAALEGTGCPYVDAGIIGPPPSATARTIFYASGEGAKTFERLSANGLAIRRMDGPIGAASAMKLSYAGITKGCTAIGSAMMLGATRGGTADALLQEMSESQPMLLNWMRGFVVRMPPKAYRWVAEMEEIAEFQKDDPGAAAMYRGIAQFYQQIADMVADPQSGDAVAQLKDFCAERGEAKRKSA